MSTHPVALLDAVTALQRECPGLDLKVVVPDELWSDVLGAAAWKTGEQPGWPCYRLEWHGVEITTASRLSAVAVAEARAAFTQEIAGLLEEDHERRSGQSES